MVFGVVISFLEGRRATEALTAGLCASFILADGFTKDAGIWLLNHGVEPKWMPSVAGLAFVPALLAGVWMLTRIPRPSAIDIAERSVRLPMTRADRIGLFSRHAAVLGGIVTLFLIVTIIRSLRADFQNDVWRYLGVATKPGDFTASEWWIAAAVLAASGTTIFVHNNRRAFLIGLAIAGAGLLVIVAALVAQRNGLIPPFTFMILIGLGIYLPYVVVHTTLLERFLAVYREQGNLAFLLTLADFVGYLGYVGVMVLHDFVIKDQTLAADFIAICGIAAGIAAAALLLAVTAFFLKPAPAPIAEIAEKNCAV
jgi:hypothetical protein